MRAECVGGSLDGKVIDAPTDWAAGHEMRLPAKEGRERVEIYRLNEDGRLHFARYGVPPVLAGPDYDPAADEALRAIVAEMAPLLDRLEAHCREIGGYFPINVGKWRLQRRDDV